MLRDIVDVIGAFLQQPSIPVVDRTELVGEVFRNGRFPHAGEEVALLLRTVDGLLADAGSGDGDLDVRIDGFHSLDDGIVLDPVLVERHMTILPWTVHLIADGPVSNLERLGMTILRAHPAHP